MVYNVENLKTDETAINFLVKEHPIATEKDAKIFLNGVNDMISKDCDHAYNCGMIEGAILATIGVAAGVGIYKLAKYIKSKKNDNKED